jgi:hypothetical protein
MWVDVSMVLADVDLAVAYVAGKRKTPPQEKGQEGSIAADKIKMERKT